MLQKLRTVQFWLFLGLVATLPFSSDTLHHTSLFIVLIAIVSIPLYFLITDKARTSRWMLLLFVSVFLFHLAGLANTENTREALFDLEKKLAILIFPLVFFFTPALEPGKVRSVLLTFTAGCLVTLLFCLTVATYRWLTTSSIMFYFYHELSGIAGMHAAYLSTYLCFSLSYLLITYGDRVGSLSLNWRLTFFASVILLATSVFLLAARTQMVIMTLGLVIYAAVILARKYGAFTASIISVGVCAALLSIALLSPVNRERLKQAVNYDNAYSINGKWGEQQLRPLIWTCAIEIIAANPLLGVGVGDSNDALENCYIQHKFGSLTYFQNIRFNAHNQFLETGIKLGLGGLLLLVASFLVPALQGIRKKRTLYIALLTIFVISCLTESQLERQSGIAFFTFFNSLLFWNEAVDEKPPFK